MFTPLVIVIAAIGIANVVFALDSIPAIFGLTNDAYIIFTANALALMGLRQLYFLIGGLLEKVVYLSKGLAVILGFIGVKLIVEALHHSHLDHVGTFPSARDRHRDVAAVHRRHADHHDRAQPAQDQPRRPPRRRRRIRLEVAGELAPVGVALLQERVAALDGLVGHVRQSRCLTGE